MLPNESLSLESAVRAVRDRMGSTRAGRFEAPPSWLRSRGPQPNKRRW